MQVVECHSFRQYNKNTLLEAIVAINLLTDARLMIISESQDISRNVNLSLSYHPSHFDVHAKPYLIPLYFVIRKTFIKEFEGPMHDGVVV